MENIRILEGTYKIRGKDQDLAGMVFPLVEGFKIGAVGGYVTCLLYTSPSPRDLSTSRMPSSA